VAHAADPGASRPQTSLQTAPRLAGYLAAPLPARSRRGHLAALHSPFRVSATCDACLRVLASPRRVDGWRARARGTVPCAGAL